MIDTAHITHTSTKEIYEKLKTKLPNIKKISDIHKDPLNKLNSNQELFVSKEYKAYGEKVPGLKVYLRKHIKSHKPNNKNTFYTVELNLSPYKMLHCKSSNKIDFIGKLVSKDSSEEFFTVLHMITDSLHYELNLLDNVYYRDKILGLRVKNNSYSGWKSSRIDYATDVHTKYVDAYVDLFRRADKPSGKSDFIGFLDTKNREHQKKGSFYLKSSSVNINFYDKLNQTKKKAKREGFIIPTPLAQELSTILRFEIQCKNKSLSNLSQKHSFRNKNLLRLYDEKIALDTILYYYDKTIGNGDYYKLDKAKKIINNSSYTTKLKNSLINTLQYIAKKRGIWKARLKFQEELPITPETFNKHIQYLRALNINPVTIPKSWNIDCLPNLRNEIIKSLS